MDYASLAPEELLSACLGTRDENAWCEFVRRFHPLISRVVLRTARQWGETAVEAIDDLIQETYLKLCAIGPDLSQRFVPSHPDAIYGYIKVFAANLVHDHFKAAHSQKRAPGSPAVSLEEEGPNRTPPSYISASAMDRNLLIQEVDKCLQAVSTGPDADRNRRIFWLYYRTGLTASAIATLPAIGLTTKGVESTLLRLTKQVRQRLVSAKCHRNAPEIRSEGIRPAESL